MLKIEYFNRDADNFYIRSFDDNIAAIPFLSSISSADTALITLDNHELFMNNSEVVAVLKKGDFYYDSWNKCIVEKAVEDREEKKYRYIVYKDNTETDEII